TAPERVAVVQSENAGFDPATFQALFQLIKTNAVSRKSGDLTNPHSQGFNNLKDAEESGRFDGNDIARPGDGAQAKVERFGSANCGDDIIGRENATALDRASGDLDPQRFIPGRRVETISGERGPAGDRSGDPVEFVHGEKLGTGEGGA